MAEHIPLEDLAASIADRCAADWDAAESSADSESQRSLIRRLRRIGEVVDARRPASAESEALVEPQESSWGHLRLLAKVGEGAFGEVYRAWDTRLDREVALKLLCHGDAATSASASSVVEEGRMLARIRHPNVVTVYGADRIDNRVGIWMDFIHGRTLEQVLSERGPFSSREASLIGLDLCQALAAVHAAGFVHRDVKAPNVIREDGGRHVLMDFGTGRSRAGGVAPEAAGLAGTPLYVAPEVLAGADASVMSDLYALGTLLYHLVTGAFPIAASTLEEVNLAHQFGRRTRLRDARPDLPDAFVRVVERAIAFHPKDRFASAGGMESALADALVAVPRTRSRWPVPVLTLSLVVTAVLAAQLWTRSSDSASAATFIEGADRDLESGGLAPGFAMSPAGSRLAYVVRDGEDRVLLTRALDEPSAHELVRTDRGISNPTFSPDGRSIAFFMRTSADSPNTPRLCRVAVTGGPAATLVKAAFGGRGIAWGDDGTIVYVSGAAPNLWRTNESGQAAEQLTGYKGSEATTVFRPQVLAGGAVLFSIRLRTGPPRAMVSRVDGTIDPVVDDADRAEFVPPGYLVFGRDRSLMGARFDPKAAAVLGAPVQLDVRTRGGWFDISQSGSIVVADGPSMSADQQLIWLARDTGLATPSGLPARRYVGSSLRLSPDARSIVVSVADDDGEPVGQSRRTTWFGDLQRGTLSPLSGEGSSPVAWSPDGHFVTLRTADGGLARKAVDGAAVEDALARPAVFSDFGTWTPDGLQFFTAGRRVLSWRSLNAIGRVEPAIDASWSIAGDPPVQARGSWSFSPDGRWIAFYAETAKRAEVYARRFRAPGPLVRISVGGGQDPRWVGNDIYYWEPGPPARILAVRVNPQDPSLGPDAPRVTAAVGGPRPLSAFEVSPDGRRFLVLREEPAARMQLRVILNWLKTLRKMLD